MAHADIINDKISVQTIWTEKELIKQIPGARWNNDTKLWELNLTWAACVQLRGVFGHSLSIGDRLFHWANEERATRVDRVLEVRELTEVPSSVVDPTTLIDDRLYPFQRAGVRFLRAAGSALLADEMGTGKTIQALVALRVEELRAIDRANLGNLDVSEFGSLPAAVICPNSTKINWANEAATWFPEATPYVIAGSAATRAKIFAAATVDPSALVIINIEAVRGHSRLAGYGSVRLARCLDCGGRDPNLKPSRCEVHPRELNLMNLRTVILDEAHRIKDPHSKQTRAAWAVGANPSVTRRYGLTGTPIADNPSDLWSIMHFIAPDENPRRTAYVDRYCLQSWNAYGGLDIVGIHPGTRDEFYKFFDARFRRMPKALVLPQLPPKVRSKRVVTLTPKQLKAYRDIESALVTRLADDSLLVAGDNLAAQIRLLQFSSAYVEVDAAGQVHLCEPSPKLDVLMEIMEELGDKQLVVAAEHKQLINLAAARLDKAKIPYGLITGDIAQWDREVNLRNFQDGKLRVMLFTLKAGGVGLTMTAADTIVFLQRSWSMIDNKQAEDRVHRIGSEKHESIHVIDIIAEGTVEDDQITRLWEKSERLEEINRDRARLMAAGLPLGDLDAEESRIITSNLGDVRSSK